MAEPKRRTTKAADGTPKPVAVPNPGAEHDQVQGGDPDSGTFRWEYVVLPAKGVTTPDDEITANGEIATETAALSFGYRPTGKSRLVSVTDHHDGVSKVVIWEVPVVRNDADSLLEGRELAEPHKGPVEPQGTAQAES